MLKLEYEGGVSMCWGCSLKEQCMKNLDSAKHRSSDGRQLSFIVEKDTKKQIYGMDEGAGG